MKTFPKLFICEFLFVVLFYVFSFSTYLPKRTLTQSLKIMQTTKNQEETLTASKNTHCYLSFSLWWFLFSHSLSCYRSTQTVQKRELLVCSVCHRDVTCFSSAAQGVCCERGGRWYPGIFQCHAGDTTSLQIWEAAVRRHPGQPPRYVYVSNLRRPSPTQTLW